MKLVSNLRNTAQGLAALQAKQQQQQSGDLPERTRADRGNQPQLIGGNSTEARAVYLALEQCLFHGIRVKEFGEDANTVVVYLFSWYTYIYTYIFFWGGVRLEVKKLVSRWAIFCWCGRYRV